jgi:hypothetical protein
MMILVQQNKKRRGPRKKCHARNYDAQEAGKTLNILLVFFFSLMEMRHERLSQDLKTKRIC